MQVFDAIFDKIPNIVWINMAKELMQSICDSIINDQLNTNSKEQVPTKIQFQTIFKDFLNNNFNISNKELYVKFKEDFLNYVMKNIKHPMASFLENDYINLLVLKRILYADDSINGDENKIFLNVLKKATDKLNDDKSADKNNPKSNARKVIQIIKDQLKPANLNTNPIYQPSQSGGNNSILTDVEDIIKLLKDLQPKMSDYEFTSLNAKLKNIHKSASTSNSENSQASNITTANGTETVNPTTDTTQIDNVYKSDMTQTLDANELPNANEQSNATKIPDANISPNATNILSNQNLANPQGANDPLVALAGANNPLTALAGANDPLVALAGANNPLAALAGANNPLAALAGANNPLAALTGDLGPLKQLGINIPTPGDISAKIVTEIMENFSSEREKGYLQIRDDIYFKFLEALKEHLTGPEGRQMYLRNIDPFFTKCVDDIIDSKAVATVTIIHLIANVSNIRKIIEDAMVEEDSSIYSSTDANDGNTRFYRLIENISNKVDKLLETKNPLNNLYRNMGTMGYGADIIIKKQSKDYEKTLCSNYEPPTIEGGVDKKDQTQAVTSRVNYTYYGGGTKIINKTQKKQTNQQSNKKTRHIR
jgi:hypothetical protein